MSNEDQRMKTRKALSLLGFGSIPTDKQLSERIRTLAKKYHPDLYQDAVKKAEMTKKLQDILSAKMIIKQGIDPSTILNKDIKIQYDVIRKKLGRYSRPGELDDLVAKLINQNVYKKNPKLQESLLKATEQYRKQVDNIDTAREIHRSIIRKRVLDAAYSNFLDPQTKVQTEIAKEIQRQAWINLIKNAFVRASGLFVPLLVQAKKPYIKKILLTSSMITAILTGKYVWNKRISAYVRNKKAVLVI
jgi:hypothetical protein